MSNQSEKCNSNTLFRLIWQQTDFRLIRLHVCENNFFDLFYYSVEQSFFGRHTVNIVLWINGSWYNGHVKLVGEVKSTSAFSSVCQCFTLNANGKAFYAESIRICVSLCRKKIQIFQNLTRAKALTWKFSEHPPEIE